MTRRQLIPTYLLGVAMVAIGIVHFVNPGPFVGMIGTMLPAPRLLVFVSGAAEIAGGLGLFVPSLRWLAAWGLVALYVAVFPANINMAVHHIGLDPHGPPPPSWTLWARLPLQGVLIAWAVWIAKRARAGRPSEPGKNKISDR